MTHRDTGGPGAGDPSPGEAALEERRRASPRRAARRAEERRAEGRRAEQVSDQEVLDRRPVTRVPPGLVVPVEPAAARTHGQVEGHEAFADPVAHESFADPAPHEAFVDPAPHEEFADPASHEEFADPPPHEVFTDPVAHEVFGDPVADGYVPVVAPGAGGGRRRRRGVGALVLLLVVAVVGGAGWYAYQALRPVRADLQGFELFAAPEDYTGAGTGVVEVVVASGDTGPQIGDALLDAGVVASVEAFLAAARAEPEFTSVQPGTYTVAQQLPAADAVAALLDPANRVRSTVVIAEGLRVEQILDRLAEGTGVPREELQAALDATELPAGAREVPGLVDPAEGFLYPDGYEFGEDPAAADIIATMIARGQEELAAAGVAPEGQLEVLTRASLVQGEARLDEDFGKVAQVVANRLAIGQPLELDSTVNYATRTFDTRTTDAQRQSDSPFNTYRAAGLPPGPIKSPGRQAIEAVAAPTPGPWLYFVTVDLCTGETAFAETYDEHLANVAVLNAWQRENQAEDGTLDCG